MLNNIKETHKMCFKNSQKAFIASNGSKSIKVSSVPAQQIIKNSITTISWTLFTLLILFLIIAFVNFQNISLNKKLVFLKVVTTC